MSCRHPAGGKQMSTGHLHLDGIEPSCRAKNLPTPLGSGDFWCGQQDSNLHALAVEPKGDVTLVNVLRCVKNPSYVAQSTTQLYSY